MRRLFFSTVLACSLMAGPCSPARAVGATRTAKPAAPVWSVVVVDLSDQQVRVIGRDGATLRVWPTSTGAPSTPTPLGRFRVTTKSVSTFVTNEPTVTMRHMTRFRGGVGFHSIPRRSGVPMWTPLGVQGVSHGCVRLADANAKELFERLAVGATVIVQT